MGGECSPLYYERTAVAGDPGRPHVLLVHGMLSSRSHWLPNLEALRAYARPVVVELYGHGRSPSPEDPTCYHPDRYVEQFERIRKALGVERWFLVGQSLGAALTLRYSLAHPERVVAQAFTNSASAFAPPEWVTRIRAAMGDRPDIVDPRLRDPKDHPLNPARNRRITPEVRAALDADVALHDPEGLAATQRYTLPETSLHGRIGEIAVPTLLVVGRREERFAPQRRFIEQHLPGIEVAELDGGHGVNLDVPADFNRALHEFFGRFIEDGSA